MSQIESPISVEVGYTDDLSKLTELDEHSLLEELKARFLDNIFYTLIGEVLVSINPYKPVQIYNEHFHKWYSGRSADQKPHIFWTASQVYSNLLDSRQNQCILVDGESGAGKTQSTQLIIQHLAYISSTGKLHDPIVKINPLIETFGNAATSINDNSSRFWKYIQMEFDEGQLFKARIFVYMLERSRLVIRRNNERNFHIFYHVLHGLPQSEKDAYGLEEASSYRIVQRPVDADVRRKDIDIHIKAFQELINAMYIVGFSDEESRMVITVIIAILHLTNVTFTKDEVTEYVHMNTATPVNQASKLLFLNPVQVKEALLSSYKIIRGERVVCLKTKEQCENGRDSIAKALYCSLFDFIVGQINKHINKEIHQNISENSIGILDMAGFENLPDNGFEQLCINGANEKMQQYYNEAMFAQEETVYVSEGIDLVDIHHKDNKEVVDLMFKRPDGVFAIVDEESMFPGASDASLKDKLDQVCSSSPDYSQSIGKNSTFAINHYAGKVKYNVEGMIESNRDNLSNDLIDCISNSENGLVRKMFSEQNNKRAFENCAKNTTLLDCQPYMERCDSRLSLPHSIARPSIKKSPSVGNECSNDLRNSAFVSRQYRRSLSELMNTMSESKPWFVRCLKPNLAREPDRFDSDDVRKQMQYNGLLEVSRMRCDGYAIRMLPEEFIQRYRDISFPPERKLSPSFQNCEIVLKDAGIQGYAFGKRQVFLRHWHRPILQDLVSDRRKEMADEQNTALSESEATDLDSTYDVVHERQGSNNDSSSFGTIAIKASPMEEITVETAITASHATPSNNDTVSPSSSRQRVSEWIEQNENAKTDVKVPSYDPGPPPVFASSLPQEQPKSNHVRIDLSNTNDRKILDDRLWDRFQMIPRERVSTSDTFLPFLRAFKFLCYVFLFCIVLGSAVVSKLCILIMTSSIIKDPKAMKEGDSPANTMLVISICFPYVCWVLSYSAKSLFGSSSWPKFKLVVVTLFVELLHSFGLCLLVFHILPRMDMARCLLNLCGIFTVPAFLKTLSTAMDSSLPGIKRFTLAVLNGIAFLIQFGNLAATTMFSLPLSEEEKTDLLKEVIGNKESFHIQMDSNITHSIERPSPTFGNRIMWEIPVSLFLISISYWENYVSSDFSCCSIRIPLLEWKKQLHSVRQRLYIFAGIWKIGWTMVFAVLLLPGFSFNLEFTKDHVSIETPPITTPSILESQRLISVTTPNIPSTTTLPSTTVPNVARNIEEPIIANFTTTPETTDNSTLVGGGRTFVKRSISDVINNAVINGDFSSILNLTEDSLPPRRTRAPLPDGRTTTSLPRTTKTVKKKDDDAGKSSNLYLIEIPQSVKDNFQKYGPLYAQMLASALLSYFGSLACKLCMQTYGFTVPLFLATPITLGIVLAQCYTNFIPSYMYIWLCPETSGDLRLFHLLWLCVLWISQLIVTGHIWSPKNGRMAKIERLFVIPLRCGVLTDLSLTLRRRVNDRDFSLFNMEDDNSIIYDDDEEVHRADDVVPTIYACATMWHETRSEMTQLLKSLFRMDIDHSARYLAQRFYGIRDPDYYEFEAHIFFDDAMDLSDDDFLVPNFFVAELIDCIDDAISSVHERQMQLGCPVRTPTPYGGRLTWKLPGGTRLIVHLKDKHKIRHKKRWSQVMYMYYLLGYRILAQPENLLQKENQRSDTPHSETDRVKLTDSQLRHRRQASHFTRSVIFNYTTEEVHTQAENTFILTLDGDVDFKPDAVRLLVDRLKKNKKVGAACGRIHPIGSGPIVWYQEFEYAIGHWLQKATEHVFGCVLCAPGCFSLFRGSALMDDNVARTYAIRASEAGHYVQYDQGEDRWLSTLLLQQGYRIDYCAAADALTHAPETFSEFFNQRRRWGPSTLANIADLLGDWKNTVRLNDNISTPYVLYQFLLLVSTILGPATVLLMMAGAFTVVFKTSVISSYAISLVPPIVFIIVCTYAKPSTQITFATILSACYAIIMTVVLVGTVGTAIEGSLTSPNVIFLIMLVFIFFIAALMHPEEFACVIPGALYFICIPTGYLILTIYYLCNLHVVSWGTREVPKRKSKEQILAEKRAEEEKKRKREQRKGFLGWLGFNAIMNEVVEMFKQFRTMTISSSEKKSKTDDLLEELIYEIRQSRDQKAPPRHRSFSTMTHDTKPEIIPEISPKPTEPEATPENNEGIPHWLKNEDPNNPGWLKDPVCGDGPIKYLENREVTFWQQLLRKYVNPIAEDRIHQEKVAADLKNLRNNVVFGFFMSSALWIALTMQLQLLQDDFKDTALFIKIPHFDPTKKELTFEPLGMVFLALFTSILLFQFIGMLSHRWGTILHVLSITEVSCSQKFTERYKVQEIIAKAMELQRVSNIENEPEPDYDDPIPDYDDDDEFDEDEETISSSYTDASLSTIASFSKPPSYHSNYVVQQKKSNFRRRNSAIFNRRGLATGRTLRRAFERRYRNQLRREKSGESNDCEGGTANGGFEHV